MKAAPEGVTVQKQLTTKDNYSQFSLREESVVMLQKIENQLQRFEKNGKTSLPTARIKIKRLNDIETLARGILDGIQELDTGSYLRLDTQLAIAPESEGVPCADFCGGNLGAHIENMQRLARNLALAAKRVSDSIEQTEKKIGRKSVLSAYAGFIAGIAVTLKADNITAGRGGPFEKICEAVFSGAGVPAKPEGAIKHFLANMNP